VVASFTATVGDDGRSVVLDASGSQGPIDSYHWRLGDGSTAEGPVVEKKYEATDTTVFVSLLVEGASSANTTFAPVELGSGQNQAPVPAIGEANRWVKPGGRVVLDASPTSDPDGDDVQGTWFFGRFPPDDPPETRFSTGVLGPGNQSEGRFDVPGMYLLQDTEHAWMRLRLLVGDADGAPANATVAIRNHGYDGGGAVRVASGGTVVFVNEDPAPRNARVVYFAAGVAHGDASVLDTGSLESGTYQATWVVEDGKGGLAARSWGVRASTDAPGLPDANFTGANVVQQGEDFHHEFPGDVLFEAMVWANLTWEALDVPEPMVDLAVVLEGTETVVGPASTCEPGRCTLAGRLEAGAYEWEARFEQGVFQSYELTTSYLVFGDPGAGNAELSGRAHGQWAP
jgi:hypothetical protein